MTQTGRERDHRLKMLGGREDALDLRRRMTEIVDEIETEGIETERTYKPTFSEAKSDCSKFQSYLTERPRVKTASFSITSLEYSRAQCLSNRRVGNLRLVRRTRFSIRSETAIWGPFSEAYDGLSQPIRPSSSL